MANFFFHDNNAFMTAPIPCGDYLVYQIGEMYCKKETVLPAHNQICHELTYIVSGSGGSGTEKPLTLKPEECFFSLPNENHNMISDPDNPLRFHFLGFKAQPNTAGEKYISIIESQLKENKKRIIAVPRIHRYLDEILGEIKQIDFMSYEVIGILISKILTEIIRANSPTREYHISNELTSESMLVYQIIDFLECNIYNIKNLYEIESQLNYSYSYLSAVFNRIMSVTINDYFRKLKMEEAKKVLSTGEKSITQISEELNYSSIHTFSRSYKKYFGFSPSVSKKEKK